MKLAIATFLLFTATVSADTNVEATFKDVVPNMATFHHEHVQNRLLESSQQCLTDTNALNSKQVLSNALTGWATEYAQNACVPDLSSDSTTIECSLDSTTLSSHAGVVSACDEAGGAMILLDYGVDCQFSVQGTDYSFVSDFRNMPSCLATTCDVNHLSGNFNEYEGVIENGLKAFDSGAQCTGSSSRSGGGGTAGDDATSLAYKSKSTSLGAMSAVLVALAHFVV